MRFVMIVVLIVLAVLAGLYIYGLTLQPDVQTLERDAIGVGDV